MPVHRVAAEGFGSEHAVTAYERGRPDYPADAVAWLVAVIGIAPGRRVLDLAAGTGKFTRMLVPSGAELVAIEPVAAMRERLARSLPGVEVVDGTAESVPLPDRSVDAATVAQAFHWFDAPAAVAELARVVRLGGGVGLIWNVRREETDFERRLGAILRRLRRGSPSQAERAWEPAFEASAAFAAPRRRTSHHGHPLDPGGVLDRVLSVSYVALLPEGERAAVAEEVRALVATHPDTAGRPTIVLRYRTDAYAWRRAGGTG